MNSLLGTIVLLHAFAHFVGFLGAFRLTSDIPYPSPLLARRLHVGDRGVRLMGVVWMVIAAAFAAAGVGAIAHIPGWSWVALAAAVASAIMCLLDWQPETKTGFEVDLALIAVLGVVLWGGVALVQG